MKKLYDLRARLNMTTLISLHIIAAGKNLTKAQDFKYFCFTFKH